MITIAICDDEKLFIENLEGKISQYLKERKLAFHISAFYSGEDLLHSDISFDIIFLDIKMDGINGMDTAKKIRDQKQACEIVFITALKEYVFDAFTVDATNYLVKPIDDKLYKTLEKILKRMDTSALSLWLNGTFHNIPFRDIRYCDVLNHTITIHTVQNTITLQLPMLELENNLNADFFRCHRSFLIHFYYVRGYKNNMVIMDGGESIPVAKKRQQEFLTALMQYQQRSVY